ncbi:MAG: helix-hairpin-helix domain-containing protein [Bacteroidales bacterium]|nr:helix-hairpin-helix domain-containing protein [Bacteroidales bacterium]
MKTIAFIALALSVLSGPKEDEVIRGAVFFSGAASVEDLDESEAERYLELSRRPVEINSATASVLQGSGLFSPYAAAALLDYRARHGDILSVAELSLVGGIGSEMAAALRPFISFESYGPQLRRVSADCSARLAVKSEKPTGGGYGPPVFQYGAKSSVSAPFGLDAFASVKGEAQKSAKGSFRFTVSAGWSHKGWKLVAGDYSLRLGQGLCVWSGFSLSGVGSPSALSRNPTGLSVSRSYTSYMRGVAASYGRGAWNCIAAYTHPDGKASLGRLVLNAGRTGYSEQHSFTCVASAEQVVGGADVKAHTGDFDFFGEAAFDLGLKGERNMKFGALAGAAWLPAYRRILSLALRFYQAGFDSPLAGALRSSTYATDEYGASLGYGDGSLSLTLDAAYHPSKGTSHYKTVCSYAHTLEAGGWKFVPEVRGSLRYRPEEASKWKPDLRLDATVGYGPWKIAARWNGLYCKRFAWLWYVEAGYEGLFRLYGRFTLFRIDDWDDRIYAYQRDGPGNFNSFAYYGRGWSASLHFRWEWVSVRVAAVLYPWSSNRSDRVEGAVQFDF